VTDVAASSGGEAEATEVLRLDEDNGIIVLRYRLARRVTPENMPAMVRESDRVVSELLGVPATGTPLTVGGFPGVSYDGLPLSHPPQGQSRFVFLVDGTTPYQIHCQSTPARRVEVSEACAMALVTLQRAS
jgi:hypothetical protein